MSTPSIRTPLSPRVVLSPLHRFAAFVAVIGVVLSTLSAHADTAEFSRISMGTRFRLVLVEPDAERAAEIAAAAFAELDGLELAMSDWLDHSELARIDAAAGADPVEVSDALHRVLRLARRMAELTDGAFDPTVGPVVRLWRAAREAERIPDPTALETAAALVDWRDLQILDGSRVLLRRPQMRLDLGAIGKGFAVDRVASTIRELGVAAFLVDFGSVVLAVGAPPHGAHWTVLRPDDRSIALRDMAVAFSGDAMQHLEFEGVRFSHIVDPRTGVALVEGAEATVIAATAAMADALATAACVVGPDAALRMVGRLEECGVAIEATVDGELRSVSTPGLSALALGTGGDGGLATTPPLRRVRRGDVLTLEVAEFVFRPHRAGWPTVTLLGVAHIGDAAAYKRLQRVLDGHGGTERSGDAARRADGIVLFESVLPDGARPPGGATADERVQSTRATMRLLADEFGPSLADMPPAPALSLEAMIDRAVADVPRNGPLLRPLARDAWGHRFQIRIDAVEGEPDVDGRRWTLVSLGADGAVGGVGENADLEQPMAVRPRRAGGGLQADLARALGLAFQMDAMDYDRRSWRPADMTMSEFAAAARARGADPGPLVGSIAGGGLPQGVARLLLGVLQFADAMSGNTIRDTLKAMMIELLAQPDVLAMADAQMGALMEVILEERNRVAIETLVEAIEDESPRSVAIFYGAAHLPDLAQRLVELGYSPERIEWHPMISLDMASSRVDERQLAQLRQMIRRMMSAAPR